MCISLGNLEERIISDISDVSPREIRFKWRHFPNDFSLSSRVSEEISTTSQTMIRRLIFDVL